MKAINTSDPTENAVARIESLMLSCKLLEIVFATYICAQENTKNARILTAGIGVAASTTADTMSTRIAMSPERGCSRSIPDDCRRSARY